MPPQHPPWALPEHRRRKKNPVPATYLKEPVAPPVESGDDGGMDIAAVQALGREEKREFSWKEGRKEGRQCNREGAKMVMPLLADLGKLRYRVHSRDRV